MSDRSAIEWTDATWNVINGCSVVSPGCTNCYAMRLAGTRFRDHPTRAGLTTAHNKAGPRSSSPKGDSATKHVWNGQVRFNEKVATDPIRWRRPRRIFVCAHGDLFHEAIPDAWRDRVFAVMALCPQHIFQILTKRPERMRAYLADGGVVRRVIHEAFRLDCEAGAWLSADHEIGQDPTFPLPNVWLGVSVEDQTRADERIPILLATPTAVRWISAEPLLGPVDLTRCGRNAIGLQGDALRWPGMSGPSRSFGARLDWVVAGGESGPGARPMHPDWARGLRDQCAAAGVPFLFKQWGDWLPEAQFDSEGLQWAPGEDGKTHWWTPEPPVGEPLADGACSIRVGKKAAFRRLDGQLHDGYPEGRG